MHGYNEPNQTLTGETLRYKSCGLSMKDDMHLMAGGVLHHLKPPNGSSLLIMRPVNALIIIAVGGSPSLPALSSGVPPSSLPPHLPACSTPLRLSASAQLLSTSHLPT